MSRKTVSVVLLSCVEWTSGPPAPGGAVILNDFLPRHVIGTNDVRVKMNGSGDVLSKRISEEAEKKTDK